MEEVSGRPLTYVHLQEVFRPFCGLLHWKLCGRDLTNGSMCYCKPYDRGRTGRIPPVDRKTAFIEISSTIGRCTGYHLQRHFGTPDDISFTLLVTGSVLFYCCMQFNLRLTAPNVGNHPAHNGRCRPGTLWQAAWDRTRVTDPEWQSNTHSQRYRSLS